MRVRLRKNPLTKFDKPPRPGELRVVHLHLANATLSRPGVSASLIAATRFLRGLHRLKARGVRVIWTVHDLHHPETTHRRLDHLIGALLIRTVDAAIVHSTGAADAVARTFRYDTARLQIVPHGHYIDWYPNTVSKATARATLGVPAGNKVFLYFGAIRKYKQVPALIDAFYRLDPPQVTLLIAGWPLNDQAAERVRAAGRDGRLIIARPEFIEDGDVQLYFNASDAVVLPVEDVLTSGSVFLAMSFARAVITPQIFPMTSALPDGGAIFYPPQMPGALENALKAACSSDLASMGERNLEHVRRNNDWGAVGRQVREIYESLR